MTESEALMDALRVLFAQEAALPALRGVLFLLGVFAAFAWWHRRPGLSLGLLMLGALSGLSFWLIQIASPLGLDTDSHLTNQWAQAGVNAFAEPRGPGYVWGTVAESSFIATLSALRVPLPIVQQTPQIAALLSLGLVVVLPLALIRNRTTAALTAGLAMGGGLWPGLSPYDALLHRPSLVFVLGIGSLIALGFIGRRRTARTLFALHPGWLCLLAALAALDETAVTLLLGSLLLAPPLRVGLRLVVRSPGFARRLEGVLLLCVFSGSGLFWWNPTQTVAGFVESTGAETALKKPLAWLAQHVGPDEVILTSPTYSAVVAAHAGRRVLVPPPAYGPAPTLREPFRRTRLRDSVYQGAPIARLARDFSLTHLFLGPGEPAPVPPAEPPGGEPRLSLVLVYQDVEDFRVFRLATK